MVANLVDGGFAGDIYPVNPRSDEILGRRCYGSLAEIEGSVDLCVIAVPRTPCCYSG